MSLRIEHVILHHLRLGADGALTAETRGEELLLREQVVHLVEQLHQTYQQKSNKSYAVFASIQQEGSSDFKTLLTSFIEKDAGFISFSVAATNILLDKLAKYDIPEEGVVIFCKYNVVGVDYILLGLLGRELSITLTPTLDIEEVNHFDVSKMQLMARIDLTEYQLSPDSNRYLSFIKGRAGRKVADFFLEFLGAEEGLDQAMQNRLLVKALHTFCQEEALEPEASLESKARVQAYCKEQLQAGDDIEMKAVAACLPDEKADDFYAFVETEFGLADSFPPSRSALRSLTKYVGSGGGVNLSFDAKLLGERIHYDPTTDTLTLQGIPPNLRDQLQQAMK
ncbi:nucleoid-associated protein YejK [Pseudaeromonas paramecii]|uniref:Nucleoid-associated protein YejK n=1 Tax=Pseudaeromonas paramecii TaxID=2138166 RepID=A0ABP8Q684_9GAMM